MLNSHTFGARLTYGKRTDFQEARVKINYSNCELLIEGSSVHETNHWDETGSYIERTYKKKGTPLRLEVTLDHEQALELVHVIGLTAVESLKAEKEKSRILKKEKNKLEKEFQKLKDSISMLKNLADIG